MENKNKKSKAGIGCLIAILIILGIGVSGGVVIFSQRNVAVNLEERIEAQYTRNQSNYDNMVKKAREMAQVTDMYAEDFNKIYKDLIEGRNQDTNLLFKVVQESNPTLDSSVYTALQNNISASRDMFDKNQSALIDIVREYNSYIKRKIIMSAITGRSPKDASQYIVTSQSTQDAFNSGQADEINLRGE